jgi:tRNA A37 threonylcarbamoyladenosine synthetase subunit TsaC/SUA5/YrdC
MSDTSQQLISDAVDALRTGNVVVLPTDTLYGPVCSVHVPEVVIRMYEIKKKKGKIGTIIAISAQQLLGLGLVAHDVEYTSGH